MTALTKCPSCDGVIRVGDERPCPTCEERPLVSRRTIVGVGVLLVASIGCDYGAALYDAGPAPTDAGPDAGPTGEDGGP